MFQHFVVIWYGTGVWPVSFGRLKYSSCFRKWARDGKWERLFFNMAFESRLYVL